MLDCQILQTDAQITAIAEEWRQLYAACGKSPFSGYEFFHAWWHTIGNANGRKLHIITGREDGKLVALLPLAVIRRKGFRVLQAVGAEGFYQCDMLCADDAYAAQLWQAARRSRQYDFAHIRDVCPDSACERALAAFASLHDRNRAPYLSLEWTSTQDWEKTVPKRAYADIVRRARRLEEKGALSYEICRDLPLPGEILRGLVEHKSAWCQKNGKQGMFDQPKIHEFFHTLSEEAARLGMLFLAWLKCGEEIVAYHLGLQYGNKLYSYVPAYNPAFFSYSPGHIMNVRAISWSIENGLKEYDQMHGDFAYKYQFSNGVRECREYTFSRSPWGWLGAQMYIKRRDLKERLAKKQAATATADAK